MDDDASMQAATWDQWADSYDTDAIALEITAAVDTLTDLAGPGGCALELGIGTGRIAPPLARRGVRVTGLDLSRQMIRRVTDQRGDLPIQVRIADIGSFETGDRYDVVYVVGSTFFLLTTQERQLTCLATAARALAPAGHVVVETAVPGTTALPLKHRQTLVREVGPAHAKISIVDHDPVTQTLRSQEIRWDQDGQFRMLPMLRRYVWPAELDLMAQMAGLRLVGRYGDWQQPDQAPRSRQVSLYRQH